MRTTAALSPSLLAEIFPYETKPRQSTDHLEIQHYHYVPTTAGESTRIKYSYTK